MVVKRSFLDAVFALLFVTSSGCAAWVPAPHVAAPLEQPFDQSTIVILDSSTVTRRIQAVPLADYGTRLVGPPNPERSRPNDPRIHPLLDEWLRDSSKTKRIDAILTFEDPIEIPRFPEPRYDQPRSSAAKWRL